MAVIVAGCLAGPAGLSGDARATQQTVATVVAGRVLEADLKQGVADAVVRLLAFSALPTAGRPATAPSFDDAVLSDEKGRFIFPSVPSGMYTLTVTKQGYIEGNFGTRRVSDTASPFFVPATGRNDLDTTLWRFSAMTGHVIDDAGEPVVGQRVAIFRRQYVSGRRRFTSRTTVVTDDRGSFRAPFLPPGEYIACAVAVQRTLPASLFSAYTLGRLTVDRHLTRQMTTFGQEPPKAGDPHVRRLAEVVWASDAWPMTTDPSIVYTTTCAPSVVDLSQAEVVTLGAGEVGESATVRMNPVKGVRVQGVLESADVSTSNTAVRLLSKGMASLMTDAGFEAAVAMTDSQGGFLFSGVPAGTYRLEGSLLMSDRVSVSSGSALRWADQELIVGEDDIAGLRITLRPGFQVTGTISLEGESSISGYPDLSRFAVRLEPADGRPRAIPVVAPAANGVFSFKDVPPGQYFLRGRSQPPGWALKSALAEQRDVADQPLELADGHVSGILVTFSNRPTGILATVRDSTGSVAPDATVYAITTERRYWIDFGWAPRRLRWVRVNGEGQAQLLGLPAGSYFVAALSQTVIDRTQDINELLEIISRQDQRIQIIHAEQKTVALVADGGRR